MKYTMFAFTDWSVTVRCSAFETGNAGEYHAVLEGTDPFLSAEIQYANLKNALKHLTEKVLPCTATPVLKRWFVSDAVNHRMFLQNAPGDDSAVSIVQQPPLSGVKAALWVYFVEEAQVSPAGENSVVMERPAYRHLFDMQLHSRSGNEQAQTEAIFSRYTDKLHRQGCTLAGNAVRTWIFVQDVDTRYAGMVAARKRHFQEQGLTEQTHYIASTGIEGKYIHPETVVLMDAYAIQGIDSRQITYLKGATHLNPTHEYGVTFERATAVDYGDRRHVFVSGTASIDNRGKIVCPFDVERQTERTWENIGVLLREGNVAVEDMAQLIVYLRDTADYSVVSSWLEQALPAVPKTIVLAPVCRAGWLVEMECIAVKKVENKGYAAF